MDGCGLRAASRDPAPFGAREHSIRARGAIFPTKAPTCVVLPSRYTHTRVRDAPFHSSALFELQRLTQRRRRANRTIVHEEDAPIYLDHNATTPILPDVFEVMVPWLRDGFGNPSSGHVYGKKAKSAIEEARVRVAELLNCSSEEIFFTSGGTEANNLAIRGVLEAHPEKRHLITSMIEHPATAKPCAYLARHGFRQDILGVDAQGQVNADEIEDKLEADTGLVTIMHANNETGVLQPITAISRVTHANGTFFHTDAAQSLGKVSVDVHALGVDLLSMAGHKLYAPKGVGALFVKKGVRIAPLLLGAGHERGLRPGTENVAYIVGLGKACEIAQKGLVAEAKRVQVLRDDLWKRLNKLVPEIALNGHPHERLPNTLSVRFPNVSGTALLAQTPEIAASTGSACHDGHESASTVITAMGIRPEDALGTVRLTLGKLTTEKHVEIAAKRLGDAWAQMATLAHGRADGSLFAGTKHDEHQPDETRKA